MFPSHDPPQLRAWHMKVAKFKAENPQLSHKDALEMLGSGRKKRVAKKPAAKRGGALQPAHTIAGRKPAAKKPAAKKPAAKKPAAKKTTARRGAGVIGDVARGVGAVADVFGLGRARKPAAKKARKPAAKRGGQLLADPRIVAGRKVRATRK